MLSGYKYVFIYICVQRKEIINLEGSEDSKLRTGMGCRREREDAGGVVIF